MNRVPFDSDVLSVASRASRDISDWLRRDSRTISVENVESKPEWQKIDVDLVWTTRDGTYFIEVKGDRYPLTGNFFFETHGNIERGHAGCMMYTEADFVYYYFVGTKELYVLPMPETLDWFKGNIGCFRETKLWTPVGGSGYTTAGRLVPIKSVPMATKFRISTDS